MLQRARDWGVAFRLRLLLAMLLLAPAAHASAAEPARKPNVIVILADDLGYADLGFQGCKDVPTPHLDALAKGGVRCTSGYASCPVCSPTRAGLLTGRYQQRFGYEFLGGGPNVGLPVEETTVANLLKMAGYATMAIGKWHLGSAPQFRPNARGFSEFYGFLGGGRSFLPLKESQGVPFIPKDPEAVTIFRNDDPVDDPPHLTDAFGDEAVAFIERRRHDPFFLYLAFNAVHVPLQATEKYLSRFPDLTGAHRTYAAMISAMDEAVGQISTALSTQRLEKHTLIFFLSDNGGHPLASTARNEPLRGEKGTAWEGGIRVPFVVKWTGHLPAGEVFSQPVICLDILPTALAAAGIAAPTSLKLDGVDLLPHLTRERNEPPHQALFWRYGDHRAIRQGKWKLMLTAGEPAGLYDLDADIGESKDLSADHPQLVAELAARYARWNAELPPPGWGPGIMEGGARIKNRQPAGK
jgi:arylsulfatase A-like enzyme